MHSNTPNHPEKIKEAIKEAKRHTEKTTRSHRHTGDHTSITLWLQEVAFQGTPVPAARTRPSLQTHADDIPDPRLIHGIRHGIANNEETHIENHKKNNNKRSQQQSIRIKKMKKIVYGSLEAKDSY